MGFKLSAMVKSKTSTITPDSIDLVSFGFRKGENEMLEFEPTKIAGVLDALRGKYRGLMKSAPNSQKPLSFSWFPRSDVKPLFPGFSGKPLIICLTVQNLDNKQTWNFEFDDVVLKPKKLETKSFAGNFNRNDERFDGVFVKFVDDK